MKRETQPVCVMLFTVFFTSTAHAQQAVTTPAQAAVALVRTFGPEAIRNWRVETEVTFPRSNLPIDQRSIAVENMLKSYGNVRTQYARASQTANWLSWETSAGAGFAALAVPQVAVPAMIVGYASSTYFDAEAERLAVLGKERGRAVLAVHKDKIVVEMGLSYNDIRSQLSTGSPEARDRFRKAVSTIDDLKKLANGDPDVLDAGADLMADVAINVDEAILDQVAVNTSDIKENEAAIIGLGGLVRKLEQNVNQQFSEAREALSEMSVAVDELQISTQDMNNRMTALEGDQAVIADFVFNSMSPAQKVAALEGGYMGNRFTCPEGGVDCKESQLRTSMIQNFKVEAQLGQLAGKAAEAATAVSDIQQIAGNLGIDLPPEFGSAAKMTNAAAGAMASIAAGNPLGAVSALTSFFGEQRDPEAERFDELMGYLGQRFDRIDAKLDEIAQNQLSLMAAVDKLGTIVQIGFAEVNDKLAELQFEQMRMGEGVRSLIWEPWKSCNGVYAWATKSVDGLPSHINPNTLMFRSEASIRELISLHEDLVLPCITRMKEELLAVGNPTRFSKIVDLRWALDNSLSEENLPGSNSEAHDWKSRLMTYHSSIFSPAQRRVNEFTDASFGGSASQAFAVLARPILTTDDFRKAVSDASSQSFSCSKVDHPDARLAGFLCPSVGSNETANSRAAALLEYPVLADSVIELANWAQVIAPLADLRTDSNWLFPADWVERIDTGMLPPRESSGELIISGMIHIIDVAVATYGQTYGPMPAAGALTLLKHLQNGLNASVTAGDPAQDVDLANAFDVFIAELRANPILARNMVHLLLEERFSAWEPGSFRPFLNTYTDAYEAALSSRSDRSVYLKTVYGDLPLTVGASGQLVYVVASASQRVEIPIPPPSAMSEGRLNMPSRYYEFIEIRDKLVERLYGYQILDDLPSDMQSDVALALLR